MGRLPIARKPGGEIRYRLDSHAAAPHTLWQLGASLFALPRLANPHVRGAPEAGRILRENA
jgi:hypothetical protein